MKGFMAYQVEKNDLTNINGLPLDLFVKFAAAGCVYDAEFITAKLAMRKQLKSAPLPVVDSVIDSAFIEGITLSSHGRNGSANSGRDDGKGNAFLSWLATEHNYGQYTSCIMIAGTEIKMAEVVAEWKISKTSRKIGEHPCKCNNWVLGCGLCPVFEEVESKEPIFKRHSLTLIQHENLNKFMINSAIETAKGLADPSSSRTISDVVFYKLKSMLSEQKLEPLDKTVDNWALQIRKDTFDGSDS